MLVLVFLSRGGGAVLTIEGAYARFGEYCRCHALLGGARRLRHSQIRAVEGDACEARWTDEPEVKARARMREQGWAQAPLSGAVTAVVTTLLGSAVLVRPLHALLAAYAVRG